MPSKLHLNKSVWDFVLQCVSTDWAKITLVKDMCVYFLFTTIADHTVWQFILYMDKYAYTVS